MIALNLEAGRCRSNYRFTRGAGALGETGRLDPAGFRALVDRCVLKRGLLSETGSLVGPNNALQPITAQILRLFEALAIVSTGVCRPPIERQIPLLHRTLASRNAMFSVLQVFTVILIAVAMGAGARARLELPGKLRLESRRITPCSRSIIRGSLSAEASARAGGTISTIIVVLLTPPGSAHYSDSSVCKAVYWLFTHPVNSSGLKAKTRTAFSSGLFLVRGE